MSATRFGWIGEWENAIPYNGSGHQSIDVIAHDRERYEEKKVYVH